MERIPSCRQAWLSTRLSDSVSSHRKGRKARTHSPVNPDVMSTSVPRYGAADPATARQVMPSAPARATAAPVPRVIEHARLAIKVKAAFRSAPSDLNSYWTQVERAPFLEFPGPVSRLKPLPEPELETVEPRPCGEAEFRTTQRGAFQLRTIPFTVNHSRSRARASSGRSEKRTPARPSASAHAT